MNYEANKNYSTQGEKVKQAMAKGGVASMSTRVIPSLAVQSMRVAQSIMESCFMSFSDELMDFIKAMDFNIVVRSDEARSKNAVALGECKLGETQCIYLSIPRIQAMVEIDELPLKWAVAASLSPSFAKIIVHYVDCAAAMGTELPEHQPSADVLYEYALHALSEAFMLMPIEPQGQVH